MSVFQSIVGESVWCSWTVLAGQNGQDCEGERRDLNEGAEGGDRGERRHELGREAGETALRELGRAMESPGAEG